MAPEPGIAATRAHSLPHYVTLRLTDALPRSVVSAWHDDFERRTRMLCGMKGRPLLPDEERNLIQRTIGRIERYLDCGRGQSILADARAAGLVESVLWAGDAERFHLHAWSVMPNHVHALLTPLADNTLEEILQEWRFETTRWVNQELRRSGALWHPDSIALPIVHPDDFLRVRSSIATNPERVGLHEWPFAGEERHSAAPRPAMI